MESQVDLLESFLCHMRTDSHDAPLIVLKGHLLLEQAMYEYISKRVRFPERLIGNQISFANLILFASALEDSDKDAWIWKSLKLANRVRNQYSHSLDSPKAEEYQNTLIDYVESHYEDLVIEVDGDKVDYCRLSTVSLHIFDELISSYPNNSNGTNENQNTKEIGFKKALNMFLSGHQTSVVVK